RSKFERLVHRSEEDLIVPVGVAQQFVVVQLGDERNPVGVFSAHRADHCERTMSGLHLDVPDRHIADRSRCSACHALKPLGTRKQILARRAEAQAAESVPLMSKSSSTVPQLFTVVVVGASIATPG
ncbi:hypothetical protein LCGC14_2606930, partial [marine sediment metagenome]